MNTKKSKPINLKSIVLEYEDGTLIKVPETKMLKVGTTFMKLIGTDGIEWEVLTSGKEKKNIFSNLFKRFFSL